MPPKFQYHILPPLKKNDTQLQKDVVDLQRSTNIRWQKIPEQHQYYWATGLLYRDFLIHFLKSHPDWVQTPLDQAIYCNRDDHSSLKNHLVSYPIKKFHEKHEMISIFRVDTPSQSYFPRTLCYILPSKFDPPKLYKKYHKEEKTNPSKRWFWKPSRGRGGRDIKIDTLHSISRLISNTPRSRSTPGIIQEEISDLYLFQDRKFELRYYVVFYSLPSTNFKLAAAVYRHGHAIIAKETFNPESVDRNKMITNRSFLTIRDRTDKQYQALLNHFPLEDAQKITTNINKALTIIVSRMIAFLNTSPPSSPPSPLPSVPPQYEVVAIDFLVDKKFHPWLMEINRNPCVKISKDMPFVQELKKNFYNQMFQNIIHQYYDNPQSLPKFSNSDWFYLQPSPVPTISRQPISPSSENQNQNRQQLKQQQLKQQQNRQQLKQQKQKLKEKQKKKQKLKLQLKREKKLKLKHQD